MAIEATMTDDKKVAVLLKDFEALRSEIRMYIQQYTPKFSIFSAFVLSLLFVSDQYNSMYGYLILLVPFTIIAISLLTAAQAYLLNIAASRVSRIEQMINRFAEPSILMEWESRMTPNLVFPLFIGLPVRNRKRTLYVLNPVVLSVASIVLVILPIFIYSTIKSYWYLNLYYYRSYAIGYVVLVGLLCLIAIAAAVSFFVLGTVLRRIAWNKIDPIESLY